MAPFGGAKKKNKRPVAVTGKRGKASVTTVSCPTASEATTSPEPTALELPTPQEEEIRELVSVRNAKVDEKGSGGVEVQSTTCKQRMIQQRDQMLFQLKCAMEKAILALPESLLDLPVSECILKYGVSAFPSVFAPPQCPLFSMDVEPESFGKDSSDDAGKENILHNSSIEFVSLESLQYDKALPNASSTRRMTRAQSIAVTYIPRASSSLSSTRVPSNSRKRKVKLDQNEGVLLNPDLPPTPLKSKRMKNAVIAQHNLDFPSGTSTSSSSSRPSLASARRITVQADLDSSSSDALAAFQIALDDGTTLDKDAVKGMDASEKKTFLDQVSAMQAQLASFYASIVDE